MKDNIILGLQSLLFIVALGIVLYISPFFQRLYSSCYYPVFQDPHSRHFIKNILRLTVVSFLFILIYGLTGGSLSIYLETYSFNLNYFLIGLGLGTVLFIFSRVWALFHNHSVMDANYFTIIIAVSCFLFYFIIFPQDFMKNWEKIIEKYTLLPYVLGATVITIIISEVLIIGLEKRAESKFPVPFTLTRLQLESFECYPRICKEKLFNKKLKDELMQYVTVCNANDMEFNINWFTTGARPEIIRRIEYAIDGLVDKDKIKIKIICHDTPENKQRFDLFSKADIKYIKTKGHIRLITIGNTVALLGVQMGENRQEHFPDYSLLIREPLRIGKLKSLFKNSWNIS